MSYSGCGSVAEISRTVTGPSPAMLAAGGEQGYREAESCPVGSGQWRTLDAWLAGRRSTGITAAAVRCSYRDCVALGNVTAITPSLNRRWLPVVVYRRYVGLEVLATATLLACLECSVLDVSVECLFALGLPSFIRISAGQPALPLVSWQIWQVWLV
jgi:hypothetical protein